ncbi:MAG: hypothetical protein DCC71_19170, partial [Proteobacteria bacterium]
MSARELARQCTRLAAVVLPLVAAGGALAGLGWIAIAGGGPASVAALARSGPSLVGPLVAA